MSDLDLARLREVAEKASEQVPDGWVPYFTSHGVPWVIEGQREHSPAFHRVADVNPDAGDDYGRAVCEHVGRFDPPTVLALLDALEQVQASRDEAVELLTEYDERFRAYQDSTEVGQVTGDLNAGRAVTPFDDDRHATEQVAMGRFRLRARAFLASVTEGSTENG